MRTTPASSQPARLVSGTVGMPGSPGCGCAQRPVPGLHHLRVQDDVPRGEDRRRPPRSGRPPAGRTRRASRSASTQLGHAIISQASGTRNGTPSSVGPERVAVLVPAVGEPGGQPHRLERHRGDGDERRSTPSPVRAPAAERRRGATESAAPSSTIVQLTASRRGAGGQRIGDRGQDQQHRRAPAAASAQRRRGAGAPERHGGHRRAPDAAPARPGAGRAGRRSASSTRAAVRPELPDTPPPGWVEAPAR